MFEIIGRSEKVAFYGVKGHDETVTYHRMKGFTEISTSKNAVEYSRRYVDEAFERTDVVGYSSSISYKFDELKGDPVHEDLVSIEENELTGKGAICDIVIVYLNREGDTEGQFEARKRSFTVVPDSSGDSTEAMTHSGSFKVNGDTVLGHATTTDGWQTAIFAEDTE